ILDDLALGAGQALAHVLERGVVPAAQRLGPQAIQLVAAAGQGGEELVSDRTPLGLTAGCDPARFEALDGLEDEPVPGAAGLRQLLVTLLPSPPIHAALLRAQDLLSGELHRDVVLLHVAPERGATEVLPEQVPGVAADRLALQVLERVPEE